MHSPHLHFHFSNLLPHRVDRSLKELFGSVAILGFAAAAVTLFEPIYLYSLGYGIREIILYYIITYILYFFLLPLGGKFAARFGNERSILVGSSILVLYYLALFGVQDFPSLFFVAPVVLAVHKIFYWIGYHADFASVASEGEIGREIGELNLVVTLVTIIGPVAGGALIAGAGFSALFLAVAILILLSNIPLLTTKEQVTPRSFSYGAMFHKLLMKGERRRLVTYLGYGEEFIVLTLWPIFVFVVLGDALSVGVLVTLSAFITSLLLLYVGKLTDIKNKVTVLHNGVIALVLSWIVRLTVVTGWQLLLADGLYRVAGGAVQYPIMAERYETAHRTGILEGVVFFEMSLALGKVLLMAVLLLLLPSLGENPWPVIFLLAALVSMLYVFRPNATIPPRQSESR